MNEESKPWWRSRTIIGVLVLVLAQVLRLAKVDIVNEELTQIVTLVMDTFGAALAIYGRVKARKAIKRTKPGGPYNPKAEVRRAKRASASLPVVVAVAGAYLAGGVAFLSWDWDVPVQDRWVRQTPEVIYYVPQRDERPFWARLLLSLRYNPIKGEVTGGAEF
jgi:hypothetical protein